MASTSPIPIERIEHSIFVVRGHRVMLDRDLAVLYGVTTKRLNEQVKRNRERFPEHFMFQLSLAEAGEVLASRSQIATLKRGQNIKYAPFVFTEHGAVMLASVLNSPVAIQASIAVVEAFIRLRQMLASHVELARKLAALGKKYDAQFKVVFDAIRELMKPPESKRQRIGFHAPAKKSPASP